MSPTFSIIIPVFNLEEYILETIRSVYAQKDKDFEVIVVDDGSTDNSMYLLEKSGFPVLMARNPHKGVGSARNHGAGLAAGDYLCFLDGDDLWPEWTLQVMRRAIQDNPGVAWVIGSSIRFRDNPEWEATAAENRDFVPEPRCTTMTNYLESYRRYMEVHTGTHAIRRDVFEKSGGYDTGLRHLEDGELYLRLSTSGPVVHITSPVVLGYRFRSGSASLSPDRRERSIADCYTVYDRARRGAYAGNGTQRIRQATIASRYFRPAVAGLARGGQGGLFFKYWLRILFTELKLGHLKFVLGSPLVFLARRLLSPRS